LVLALLLLLAALLPATYHVMTQYYLHGHLMEHTHSLAAVKLVTLKGSLE
jgi:hypothetical protein